MSNSRAGLIDVEAEGEKVMSAMRPRTPEAEILGFLEDKLRQGNLIYAADLNEKQIFQPQSDGSWKFNLVIQPLRGKKPDVGNESPK